jgi:hypothetical protein
MKPSDVMDAIISLIRPVVWQPRFFSLKSGKVIHGVARGVHAVEDGTVVEILSSSSNSIVRISVEEIERVDTWLKA